MKIPVTCFHCLAEDFGGHNEPFMHLDLRDDDLYEGTCPKGHRTVAALKNSRFEVLFSIGIEAIIDGYPREAISSFAAALERFYEFSIRVMLSGKDFSMDEVAGAWKLVKNQSERQLGAYIFLHLSCLGTPPILLKNVELRNAVVHKGKLPSLEEAKEFGEEVRRIISSSLATLKNKLVENIALYLAENDPSKGCNPSLSFVTHRMWTAFSLHEEGEEHSVSEILDFKKIHRKFETAKTSHPIHTQSIQPDIK